MLEIDDVSFHNDGYYMCKAEQYFRKGRIFYSRGYLGVYGTLLVSVDALSNPQSAWQERYSSNFVLPFSTGFLIFLPLNRYDFEGNQS